MRVISDRRGFALEATMILLVLMASLAAAAVMGAAMVQRNAGVDYRGTRVNYAAEAGADNVMAQLETAMIDGIITDAELAALTPPALPGFTITTAAARNGAAAPRAISNGPYSGLIGLNQRIDITVSAVDATRNRSDAIVSVNAQSIPLFQFGVFYEDDLEIHNGPRMDFAGWVHTNGNLYLCSDNTYFQDIVTTPRSVILNRKPINAGCNGVYINNAASPPAPVRLTFDSRSQPTSAGFTAASNASFNGRLMTSASGVTPLRLPLPVGMNPIELVNPRVAGDPPAVQNVKMSWKADYNITFDLTRLTTPCAAGVMTVVPARVTPDPTPGSDCDQIFRGTPNKFLDGREDIGVDVLDIDIGRLMQWIDVAPGPRAISIMYISFVGIPANPLNGDYPAIRVINGRTLTHPITIATDRPLYIKGNYNDIGWRPASFLADAVTFQSANWDDAQQGVFVKRGAGPEMWVYAAIAAGHSSTPCDWINAGCVIPAFPPPTGGAYPNYGGGLENFPRFLENWGGVNMHYRGSLVSLFDSRYAALRRWSWRNYYDPPTRDWQFDTRFRDPANLPPGTPTAGSVTQIAFRPVY